MRPARWCMDCWPAFRSCGTQLARCGPAARTEFRVLERFPDHTYVEADLSTGRTHQLRVHFAYISHPVAGDRTYGKGRAPSGLERQFVHSRELTLTSPATRKAQTWVAEL